MEGDVIIAEYDNVYEVFIYLGNGKLVQTGSDGICTLLTSSGDAFSGTNVFTTLIAYDRFAVLRPSLAG